MGLLNNTISQLQNIIQTSDAKAASDASKILFAIRNKKPDDILIKYKNNLSNFVSVYHNYSSKKVNELKLKLSDINILPAIDIIIILHLLTGLKTPSKIIWPKPYKKILKSKYTQEEIDFLLALNDEKPTTPPPRYVAEYIQDNRVLPSNTPLPGPWKNWRSQYAVEIMDCMSPYSPIQHVDVMSASQVVKTSLMENTIGYYMGANPAPILFMSGTDALLKKWATKRLEPLIDSLGLRHKLIAPVENEKSRRTGDTTFQKLFTGGFLEMASAQSPSSQRSDSVRILCLDELDAAPPLLNTGEGYWDENAEARTKAWGNRRKILATSTPTEYQTSTIYRRFQLGDQCEYFVHCPLCGKPLLLELNEGGNHGLRAETKNGQVEYVYYLCEHCHDAIFEHQKNEMIRGGKWVPKTTPERLRRSFHINSLLSPLGLYSWIDFMTDLSRAKKTPEGMRVFTNHQEGRPYIASGVRPKAEKIIENRGKYRSGTIPDGVLYLTAGIDVQRGSKNNPDNPPRIEMEVLGIGYGYRTWSIEYRVFEGPVNNPFCGAWEDLYQYAMQTNFNYIRREDGFSFPVSMVLIDSGDGETTETVYRFCNRWTNTFPSKGFRSIRRRKNEAPDEMTDGDFKKYRIKKIDESVWLYEISTVYYKNNIYNNLSISRLPQDPQAPGFCDFPVDYGQKYFDMLTAEEKMSDGSFESHGRRNEALDCRVYNLCAADAFLDSEVLNFRAWAKQNGAKQADIQKITHRYVIDRMIESTKLKKK